MENRNTQAGTSFGPDDRNVATWALPEGAIARLGRGSVRDMAFHQTDSISQLVQRLDSGYTNSQR